MSFLWGGAKEETYVSRPPPSDNVQDDGVELQDIVIKNDENLLVLGGGANGNSPKNTVNKRSPKKNAKTSETTRLSTGLANLKLNLNDWRGPANETKTFDDAT